MSGHASNRLRDALSPYLLQHARNPVDWYPWGEEALEKAKREDKPIFLSIGYAACHWCHVMERESFENERIAAYMNEHFVNIKVDREERPDLDEIYMSATLALSGSGGWPMSVFLTPELKPFFAGTYFPPDARYGRPGFPQLLESIDLAWKTQRTEVVRQADRLARAIERMASVEGAPGFLTPDLPAGAARALVNHFDDRYGGFGHAPKFPNPMGILLLLREYRRTGDQEVLEPALFTLRKMAEGGIYDHLGGGFARYSTDEEWLVPHFEKMLYDQAQLVRAYVAAWKLEKDDGWARIVRETCDYVLREMQSPEGGFYSTQDADSEGVEGKFFVWTPKELEAVLGPEDAALFAQVYDVTEHGNFEHKSILHPVRPIDAELRARLAPMRRKLWEVREKRVKPGLDDKVLADWNGYMIHALAEAGSALNEPRYIEAARRAARFWTKTLIGPDGRLQRVFRKGEKRHDGLQIDYASLALGFVALYQATLEPEWLLAARKLVAKMNELFWDEAGDGYFATEEKKDLIARTKSPHDGATPAGNSVAVHALLALHRITGEDDLKAKAEKTMRLFRATMEEVPSAVLNMLGALQEHLEGPPEIALVGARGEPELEAMRRAIHERFLPGVAVALADPELGKLALLEGKTAKDGKATAYVCRQFACEAPVTSVADLERKLDAPPKA